MKKENIQIRVILSEKELIKENARRNGFVNLSEYLRILGMSKNVVVSVAMPNVMHVSEAQLGAGEERQRKRATG